MRRTDPLPTRKPDKPSDPVAKPTRRKRAESAALPADVLDGAPPAHQVRELRAHYDLTAAAAAELVHVTENAWRKWERGARAMDLAHWELFLIKIGARKP
jgi:DNA-binding transcriptional regulator YiaG